MLKYTFKYIDEFNNSVESNVELTEDALECGTHLDLLVEQFQHFLLGAGFMEESINQYFKKESNELFNIQEHATQSKSESS